MVILPQNDLYTAPKSSLKLVLKTRKLLINHPVDSTTHTGIRRGVMEEGWGRSAPPPDPPKRSPRGSQVAPRGPQEPPRRPQEHQKGAKESHQTPERASSDPQPWFFENRAPAEAKSRFLRVGGTAWEVKIITKRVQDKKNNQLRCT